MPIPASNSDEADALVNEPTQESSSDDPDDQDQVEATSSQKLWALNYSSADLPDLKAQCLAKKCALMGPLPEIDLRGLTVKQLEAEAEKRGEPNLRAAPFRFVTRAQKDDLILIGDFNHTIYALGRIVGDYVPPGSAENPSTNPKFRHTRAVNWLWTQPLTVSCKLDRSRFRSVSDIEDRLNSVAKAFVPHSSEIAGMIREIRNGATAPKMQKRIWKIAPERNARRWDDCRTNNCIAIFWLRGSNLREFATKKELLQALQTADQGSTTNANTVWSFVHDVQVGDIVVANKGESNIVGIGVVTSPYIGPNDVNHPSPSGDLPHTRGVNWLIQAEAEIDFRFNIPTIQKLDNNEWQSIKTAYLLAYPDNSQIKAAFATLEGTTVSNAANPLTQQILGLSARTRNILLYGPPGTGKTYALSRLREQFLKGQTNNPARPTIAYLQSLNWHDVIALALELNENQPMTVPDLVKS